MTPVVAAIVTGAVVVAGKWARDKPPTMQNAIGVAGIAIGLAVISTASDDLARAFGALIVVAVSLAHLPVILAGSGLAKVK